MAGLDELDGLHELVAAAFGLGRPVGELCGIQVSSYETWRLDTVDGSYLVKRLWNGTDPPWRSEYELAMELEGRARKAGIATAVPVSPVEPVFGAAARIDGHGVWRAYEWLEHTALDVEGIDVRWFGDTLSRLHGLYPLGSEFEPEWRWLGVYARDTWDRWLAIAAQRRKTWAPAAGAELDRVLAISAHVREHHQNAPDHVVSHLDFGPWNVLHTAGGLVLIDWESAGPTTASAELGRAVSAFGQADPSRMRRLVEAYRQAGGTIACRPEDLFIWQTTQQLSGLTERIRIELGDVEPEDDPDPVWMNASTIEADIIEAFTSLPARLAELRDLGVRVLPAGDR